MNPSLRGDRARQRGGAWWLRRGLRALPLALGLLAGCVYLPQPALPDPATLTAEARADQNELVYTAAWELVRDGYFDVSYNGVDWKAAGERHLAAARDATNTEELYAAINALIDELQDDHTHALSPRESAELASDQRVLLGLMLRPENPAVPSGPQLVFATLPGSAAAESGVQPGWLLVSCDGVAPNALLGVRPLEENQVVQCVFRDREDREITLALTARTVSTEAVMDSQVLADGSLRLRFDRFDRQSAHWLREQLKQHARAPGVIIDLRQNPGGDAAALGRMLGEFFARRVNMGTFITRRGLNDRLQAWRWIGSASYRGPLAVLVSANSASSSEIFAAVIQHHDRGTIIGEPTAGAVLASRFFPLPGGGRLQLSIDNYVTPDGRRLEGAGVTPDVVVETSIADVRAGRDPALEAARVALRATGH